MCFSPSGQFIAIGERGKKPALRVFQLSTGREVANLQQHAYGIKAAAFSPDDSLVVSVGYECVCAVVAVPGRRVLLTGLAHLPGTTATSTCGIGTAKCAWEPGKCHSRCVLWPSPATASAW